MVACTFSLPHFHFKQFCLTSTVFKKVHFFIRFTGISKLDNQFGHDFCLSRSVLLANSDITVSPVGIKQTGSKQNTHLKTPI